MSIKCISCNICILFTVFIVQLVYLAAAQPDTINAADTIVATNSLPSPDITDTIIPDTADDSADISDVPDTKETETSENSDDTFFDSLESSLVADYRLCTGDSTSRSRETLLQWRSVIDSITTSDDYPTIVRKYHEETGIHPSDARPCEIIKWMQSVETEIQETSALMEQKRRQILQQRKDLMLMRKELAGLTPASYDIGSIPFGISRSGFELLYRRDSLPPVTREGRSARCDTFHFGSLQVKAAFHFNKEDRYWCYEFEGRVYDYDSLDTHARADVERMSEIIAAKTQTAASHLYRVGRFDIVPGRLAICRLWNFPDASIYVGLARTGNGYYAKTIVQQR